MLWRRLEITHDARVEKWRRVERLISAGAEMIDDRLVRGQRLAAFRAGLQMRFCAHGKIFAVVKVASKGRLMKKA